MRRRQPRQLELPVPPTWGGRRQGAGRRPGARPWVPRRTRPPHSPHHPVHVTLRAVAGLRSFRSDRVFRFLREALGKASKPHFRLVEFSVQSNHLHLLVEADSRLALIRGVQGLAIRTARAINRALERKGKVWGDRLPRPGALDAPRDEERPGLRAPERKQAPGALAGAAGPLLLGPVVCGVARLARAAAASRELSGGGAADLAAGRGVEAPRLARGRRAAGRGRAGAAAQRRGT